LYKTAMHFCLASAASADASILSEGKGGGNLDAAARTIVNDRGALSPGAVVLVASETIEAFSDEIKRCERCDQQQSKDQDTITLDAEIVCSLFLDGLRAVRVVCELEVPGPVMAGRLAMASASTLLALSVVFAKYSNQNLQDIARRKNMLEMCVQSIDALIDCKAVYASPRRCKALLDAATAAAKRTSALSAEEMISQANTTTDATIATTATTPSPAVDNSADAKVETIEISRSFDARRLRRKRRINRGGRVKMSASSKRREQQSAMQRSGAVGRKRSRDIRNYEVASESEGSEDDDEYYDDDSEDGGYGAAAIMEEFEPSDIDESDDDDSDDNNDDNDGGFGMRGGGITGWG